MLFSITRRWRIKKREESHDVRLTFVSSGEYYEKLRLIGLELFNKYINSPDLQDEVVLAWGALFHLISGELAINSEKREEIKSEIRKRLESLIYQLSESMKSNWELGFAASVYLYVLKMIGSNVDDLEDKLHSILKSVNFYRIVGVNKIPEFLGFTFAMFNETCPDDACKLYYFMYKKINNEDINPEQKQFNRNDPVESLLAYYIYGESSGLQLNQLWTQIIREIMEKDVNEYMKNYEPYGGEYHSSEVFIPKERLFLLLILMKLLNLDKVVYVIGLSNEEEMKEILEIDKEIKKAHRRATIILVSSLISITFLIIWGFVIPFMFPSYFQTLLHSIVAIAVLIISYMLGLISIIIGIVKRLSDWVRVKKVN
ncbi:hypothetical protein YG5714_1624 [Sulfolobus islandicus Y.G.57.14]|uniref:Uncharacterized protein n=1 Tax=Saccharolobus islandicus (strain Y.G.57.14 / Yellowstone \|nr:hypothetical protein [Sulfolobus islandicus]ACP45884.1 hypothetical protein YG5714_1624 [Sulfolobus islandicus Y.G.57.14]